MKGMTMTKRSLLSLLGGVALSAGLIATEARAIEIEGDLIEEYTVFRPDEGNWYVGASQAGVSGRYQWGLPGDIPVPGNFRSTGFGEFGVFRPTDGTWYLRFRTGAYDYNSAGAYQWGLPGDVPVVCDYNNDDLSELTVFRPSNGTWYQRISDADPDASYSTSTSTLWGQSGDTPIPTDVDGDGRCDITVYRNGVWFSILSSVTPTTAVAAMFGQAGDIPVPGQWDSDSTVDLAVYRPTTPFGPLWIVRQSSTAQTVAGSYVTFTTQSYQWGLPGDYAVPGDYDGDGKTDLAVWRPSSGIWYIRTSSTNYADAVVQQWGLPGDTPIGTHRGVTP